MNNKTLFELVHQAWKCYIRGPLLWSETPLTPTLMGSLSWFVCVSIEPSHKTMLLGIDQGLAKRATCDMFGYTDADAVEEDMRDAIGEIANIIAGSIKTIQPDFTREDTLELPLHLTSSTAQQYLTSQHVDAAVLACSEDGQTIYTAILSGHSAPPTR